MTIPALIAQLLAAAENATKGAWEPSERLPGIVLAPRGRIVLRATEAENAAYIVAAQPQNITRILDAYAEMERVLRDYAVSEIYGARARAALQQKDKADE